MVSILIHWALSALCLLLVAHILPGFILKGFGTALIASVVIGFINGTLGLLLKLITLPLTILTLGLFWFVINALMLKLAAAALPGFEIRGFFPALIGALLLSLLNMIIRWLT